MLTKICDDFYVNLSKIEIAHFMCNESGDLLKAAFYYKDKDFELTGEPAMALKIALNKHFGETNED